MTRLACLALCALLLPLAACDSGEESDLAAASFTLRVDGGSARTFAQSAYFGAAEAEGMDLFGILLGDQEGSASAGFVRLGATPGAGSYRVADLFDAGTAMPTNFQGFYIDPDRFEEEPEDEIGTLSGFYYARSGTVTLDRVVRQQTVEGRFEMSVQAVRVDGFDPDDPEGGNPMVVPVGEPFPISGAFNASYDASLFSDIDLPDGGLTRRRLAVPPGLIRLPGLGR